MPFNGVFSVLPTPFDTSGTIDPASLKRVVDLFIADGVNGFTALGVTSEVARLTESARDVPGVRTIKLEDPPTPFKTSRILEQTQGMPIAIFGGLGGVFLLEELMAGAAGAMTGFAYPAILVKIVTLFRAGQLDEAADAFYANVPLMRFEFQEGIGMAIRKEVLRRRGAIADAGIRAPGGTLDDGTRQALDRVMAWTGVGD